MQRERERPVRGGGTENPGAVQTAGVHDELTGLPEYRFFATALALQAQTGGGLSETLDNLAEVIRKRVAMRSRAQALASEAKTSTYILAALPVVTGGLLGVINPTYIGVLFTESAGNKLLGFAIGMLAVGMTVMRLIIAKALK